MAPGAASHVNRPCWPAGAAAAQLVETLKPGNKSEVLPAGVGRLLVRFTVTVVPSVTIIVGPGICMVLQYVLAMPPGRNVGLEPVTHPYPHE